MLDKSIKQRVGLAPLEVSFRIQLDPLLEKAAIVNCGKRIFPLGLAK